MWNNKIVKFVIYLIFLISIIVLVNISYEKYQSYKREQIKKQFFAELNNKNYSAAIDIFNNKMDETDKAKAIKEILPLANNALAQYVNNNNKEAEEELKNLLQLSVDLNNEEFNNIKNIYLSFKHSRESFEKLKIAYNNKAYLQVINEFSNILPSDTLFFSEAEKIKNQSIVKLKEWKKELQRALNKMTTKCDEIENITWFFDSSFNTTKNVITVYFGADKNKNTVLRGYIRQVSSDYLDIRKFIFSIDGNRYEIDVNPEYLKNTTSGFSCVQWYDFELDSNSKELFKKIADSKKAFMKIQTEWNGYFDREITKTEKKAISNVLNAYEAYRTLYLSYWDNIK